MYLAMRFSPEIFPKFQKLWHLFVNEINLKKKKQY